MNDTMSLLLATGILAVGGLGLFMYKSGSDDKNYNDNDESFFDFDLKSYFGSDEKDEDDNKENDEDEEDKPEFYEPPKRSRGSKTKSTRKSSGTKIRY
jgi:hypothetical protein